MKRSNYAFLFIAALAVLVCTVSVPVSADGLASRTLSFTKPAIAIGITACLLSSKTEGETRASKAADSVLLSVGIAKVLKRETSIDSGASGRHTFPSGHTAAAFAIATNLAEAHPKQKWYYYAGAALIGYSTIQTGSHSWGDVIGGATLGITVSKFTISSQDGIFLSRVHKF